MKPVLVERLPRKELRKARDWYERKQAGLGSRLLSEVLEALARIEQHSEIGPRYKSTRFRFYALRRFPYVIYYECLPNHVRVIAIAHQRQREAYWKRRKPN